MHVYGNAPCMSIFCMYASNYCQQLTQTGHLCSSGVYSSTKLTNTHLWQHSAPICGSPGHATIIAHINQDLYNYQLYIIYTLPVETINTSQLAPRNGSQWYKKEQAITKSTRVMRPITADLTLQINTTQSQQPHCYNNIMMWAACCLAFFSFLCASNFTIPP